jgi:hypothetical protein
MVKLLRLLKGVNTQMPKAPSHVDQHLNRFYKRVKGKLAVIEATAKRGQIDNMLALDALGKLKPLTEYVNQFHHEYVCIQALRRLKKEHADLEWCWYRRTQEVLMPLTLKVETERAS